MLHCTLPLDVAYGIWWAFGADLLQERTQWNANVDIQVAFESLEKRIGDVALVFCAASRVNQGHQ